MRSQIIPCTQWCWMRREKGCRCAASALPEPDRINYWSRSPPALFAARICMWSMASCPIRNCRLFRVMKLSGGCQPVERMSAIFLLGRRVGIPWLGWTCGHCRYCLSGHENLCVNAKFTGYQIDGGYAEYTVADARYCFRIPEAYNDAEAAPLLCAGLIGYRALKMTGDAERVGIYGFGAAAHIVAQILRHQGKKLFAFTRHGDTTAQEFAMRMGAAWAGDSDTTPPEELDAAIIFAPGRRPGARCAARSSPRRNCRVWRYPHERYPVVSL